MMRKEIVLLMVVAVLILGGTAAVFDKSNLDFQNNPIFDPDDPKGGSVPLTPDGEPLPPGPL